MYKSSDLVLCTVHILGDLRAASWDSAIFSGKKYFSGQSAGQIRRFLALLLFK